MNEREKVNFGFIHIYNKFVNPRLTMEKSYPMKRSQVIREIAVELDEVTKDHARYHERQKSLRLIILDWYHWLVSTVLTR